MYHLLHCSERHARDRVFCGALQRFSNFSALSRGLPWTPATCQWSRPLPIPFTSNPSNPCMKLPIPTHLFNRAPSIRRCSSDSTRVTSSSTTNSTSLCPLIPVL